MVNTCILLRYREVSFNLSLVYEVKQLVYIGIPTICWYTMPSKCTYVCSIRKVKASYNSVQVQHVYESYFSLEKNPALSDVQRYFFYSLLKHHLTKDTTFTLKISCGKDCIK